MSMWGEVCCVNVGKRTNKAGTKCGDGALSRGDGHKVHTHAEGMLTHLCLCPPFPVAGSECVWTVLWGTAETMSRSDRGVSRSAVLSPGPLGACLLCPSYAGVPDGSAGGAAGLSRVSLVSICPGHMDSSLSSPELDWRHIDPTDPERLLTPLEQNFVVRNSTVNVFNLMKEIPDLKRLENAYKRFLETFPMLLNKVEMMPNKAYRYKPQPIVVPDFQKLYDSAVCVSTSEELIDYALELESKIRDDDVALTSLLVKVDVEKSKHCPIFRGRYYLVLYSRCSHAIADGTSINSMPKYINMYYEKQIAHLHYQNHKESQHLWES